MPEAITTVKDTNKEKQNPVKWNPWIGVLLVVAVYVLSQIVGLVVFIYPVLRHWSTVRSTNWINNSITAQLINIAIVEIFTILAVLQILKWYGVKKKVIGLKKPKLKDPLYALAAVPVYFFIYFVVVTVVHGLIKGVNITETQNVGFTNVHGITQLIETFISLVIFPPLAEEILVRGFLYSSLKKGLPTLVAAILTSVIFASAHLPEGTHGLLWIAFIDTFILSMVLIFLREKTKSLWAGMFLHAFKNGIAYYFLYIASIFAIR